MREELKEVPRLRTPRFYVSSKLSDVLCFFSFARSDHKCPRPHKLQDLTIFVQQLLEQMQGRFSQMSDQVQSLNLWAKTKQNVDVGNDRAITLRQLHTPQIIGRIDEMGGRIDDLEKSIGDLMEQVRSQKIFGPCLDQK